MIYRGGWTRPSRTYASGSCRGPRLRSPRRSAFRRTRPPRFSFILRGTVGDKPTELIASVRGWWRDSLRRRSQHRPLLTLRDLSGAAASMNVARRSSPRGELTLRIHTRGNGDEENIPRCLRMILRRNSKIVLPPDYRRRPFGGYCPEDSRISPDLISFWPGRVFGKQQPAPRVKR